jgi:hypothetical protein
MKININWTWPAMVVLLLSAIHAIAPHSETIHFTQPLFASEVEANGEASNDTTKQAKATSEGSARVPWLHVTVETNYGWFYQESIGKAWTTRTRVSEERVKVGSLCLSLTAHNEIEKCLPDTSYIEVRDIKRRIATRKKTATATAWAENPAIDRTSVSLDP